MASYTHLIGAEEISSAARSMRGTASEITNATSSLAYALERHQQFLEDWLVRFEATLSEQRKEKT